MSDTICSFARKFPSSSMYGSSFSLKISSLLAFIDCINDPWIVISDLNVSPSTLLAQTLFQDMGLRVLVPDNFELGPTGSLIDFAFAPAAGAAL